MKDREKIERPGIKRYIACNYEMAQAVCDSKEVKALEEYATALESRIAVLEEQKREDVRDWFNEAIESGHINLEEDYERLCNDYLNSIKEK